MIKDAWKKYVKTILDTGACLGYLALFCIISFILIYFSGSFALLTLIATIALLISPALFAYQGSLAAIHHGSKFSTRYFFNLFFGYFSRSYSGVYRMWMSFLKAALVYLVADALIALVGALIAMNIDADLYSLVIQYVNSGSIDEMTANLQLILENSTFKILNIISVSTSLGLAAYMFLHSIAINSLALYTSFSNRGRDPMNYVSYVSRYAFRSYRKGFYKNYYRGIWPLIISYVVGYIVGILVSSLYLVNAYQIAVCGLIGATINLLILSSFYFAYLENLYEHYFPYVKNASLELTKKAIEEMKKIRSLNEERLKDYEESINEFDKKLQDEENNVEPDGNPFEFDDKKDDKKEPPDDGDSSN